MKSLSDFLIVESFKNLFPKDKDAREKYGQEVFDLLTKAYKKIGGIKGKGFNSVDDMIKNIPFWKLNLKDGKVNALILYKDREGRKSVAGATDFTSDGKSKFKEMLKADLEQKRSFGEKSGPLLHFLSTNFPKLTDQFSIPAEKAIEILTDGDESKKKKFQLIPGEKYLYNRKLSDGWHAKRLIGTPGNKIT